MEAQTDCGCGDVIGFLITFSGNVCFTREHPTFMPRKKQPTRGFDFAVQKPTVDDFLALGVQVNRTNTDFLKVDLETALTFSGIALQSKDDPVKRQRNRHNARRGYDVIVRLRKKVILDDYDERLISRKLQRLKAELKSLGDTF